MIRAATIADARELARLRWDFRPEAWSRQSFEAYVEAFVRWTEDAFGSGRWTAAVAEEGGRLVGCMFLQSVAKVPDPGAIDRAWGYVTHAYVEPGHRGHGAGTRLLETLIGMARERDHELLIVWPSEEAVSLYRRAGFRSVDEAHAGPGDHPPLELTLT